MYCMITSYFYRKYILKQMQVEIKGRDGNYLLLTPIVVVFCLRDVFNTRMG